MYRVAASPYSDLRYADATWTVDRPDLTAEVDADSYACNLGFYVIFWVFSPSDSVILPSKGLPSCNLFDQWVAFFMS